MNDIILKYIESPYSVTLSTAVSYKVYDKVTKKNIGLLDFYRSVSKVLGVPVSDVEPVALDWIEGKQIEINNRITDFKYKTYQMTWTVVELELTLSDLNKVVEYKGANGIIGIISKNNSAKYNEL